ncbi:hypothetical protein [Thermoflavimicrobium dichotomicum]|uniref:Uncharacterized protein n=1 Tax=Thermoflavimicrobium dichotomicum TaxID=46223 RepID=A0A1I3K6Y0_9BACL|nr:hypothetical protein [Thermoflavimicrobium dichotomicum]SFI68283.1 hypothetical protein SAMN05421852_101359 [Thermoflavimicrobium dichotomicum]
MMSLSDFKKEELTASSSRIMKKIEGSPVNYRKIALKLGATAAMTICSVGLLTGCYSQSDDVASKQNAINKTKVSMEKEYIYQKIPTNQQVTSEKDGEQVTWASDQNYSNLTNRDFENIVNRAIQVYGDVKGDHKKENVSNHLTLNADNAFAFSNVSPDAPKISNKNENLFNALLDEKVISIALSEKQEKESKVEIVAALNQATSNQDDQFNSDFTNYNIYSTTSGNQQKQIFKPLKLHKKTLANHHDSSLLGIKKKHKLDDFNQSLESSDVRDHMQVETGNKLDEHGRKWKISVTDDINKPSDDLTDKKADVMDKKVDVEDQKANHNAQDNVQFDKRDKDGSDDVRDTRIKVTVEVQIDENHKDQIVVKKSLDQETPKSEPIGQVNKQQNEAKREVEKSAQKKYKITKPDFNKKEQKKTVLKKEKQSLSKHGKKMVKTTKAKKLKPSNVKPSNETIYSKITPSSIKPI